MTTITVAQCNQRINAVRAELAKTQPELKRVGIAAITDRGLIPKRDELSAKIQSLEADIPYLEEARDLAQRAEDEAAAAALDDRRREVHGVAMGHVDELVELAGELDTTLQHLRTLMTRADSVDAAWRSAVTELIPSEGEPRRRAFETLSLVGIVDHRDISEALNEIDGARSRTIAGDFAPRVDMARLRAEQAPARIAQALGIATPSRSKT